MRDFGTDFGDDARRFVAEDHRLLDDVRPDLAVQEVMQVAAADADVANFDLDVARTDSERHIDVTQFEIERFFQNQSLGHDDPLMQ